MKGEKEQEIKKEDKSQLLFLWKGIWRSLKKLLSIYPKECKSGFNRAPAHSCLLQHYSQWTSFGNGPDALQLMSGSRKCGIYTHWSFIQSKRKMKLCCL
jgi:hypothetical protein